jgi:formylglycine-generating enzyme required for sulfatase activity
VRAEASYGLKEGLLISIAIERDLEPPIRFLNIHTEALIGWDAEKPSPAFDKIVTDLEAILGKPKPIEKAKPVEPVRKKAPDVILPELQQQEPKLDDMVKIPKGLFLYGEEKTEKLIDYDYAIDVFPVTNERYKEFLDEDEDQRIPYQAYRWSKPYNWSNKNRTYPKGRSNHPVVLVSYEDAKAFCKWRSQKEGKNYRLPLEEEWEKAARGTDGREYPWGNEFDMDKCNTDESEFKDTTEVTRYPDGSSPFGCYDMAGNVLEWTASIYDKKEGTMTLRGGSWNYYRDDARCADRGGGDPDDRIGDIGFRCVRTK